MIRLMDIEADETETQWTEDARAALVARSRAFVAAIEAHVAQTLTRTGRQAEIGPYFESADLVNAAARAFGDAEFDWCGSSAIRLSWSDEDEPDDGVDDEDDGNAGGMVSVIGRWDFEIVDEQALIAQGRQEYLTTWADDLSEDAEYAVNSALDAVREIVHDAGPDRLIAVDSLQLRAHWSRMLTVPTTLDDIDEDDPFSFRVDGTPLFEGSDRESDDDASAS